MTNHTELVTTVFERVVEPVLFDASRPSETPTLQFALSASSSGRSRATGALADGAVVLNARDLDLLARSLGVDAPGVATSWLQQGLTVARERRVSLVLEGGFRSPTLAIGLAQLFAESGYRSQVSVMAQRASEVRMSDASRRFDTELRRSSGVPSPVAVNGDVATLLPELVSSGSIDRVTVFDRTGTVVFDEERDAPKFPGASSALEEATATRLGTMRSTLWLSELRRMTRMLGETRSAPRWAVDELIALHEVALTEIVPELPISAGSDTATVQVQRLTATRDALRKSVTPEVSESVSPAPVLSPQQDLDGLSR